MASSLWSQANRGFS